MGAGASTGAQQYEFSPEEKVEITKTLQEKYNAIKSDEAFKDASEVEIFSVLSEAYAKESYRLMEKRGGVVPVLPDDGDEGGDVLGEGETFSFGIDSRPGALTRQQTSSELLAALSSADLNDQEKIASFISRLKEGEVAVRKTSEFRKRRLTYEQKTTDKPVPQSAAAKAALEAAGIGGGATATATGTAGAGGAAAATGTPEKAAPPARAKRTAIFASSEIGSRQEKKSPFPPHLMGTFSCHGIEPAEDENGEDAVHDKINQDRGCVVYPYRTSDKEALFLVLDGHGEQGDRVSEFVMRQIVISLEKHPSLVSDPSTALKETFTKTNTALMVTPINYMTSGCTCAAVYMVGSKLYVANAGDSRVVMAYDENGTLKARNLSRDHKPDDPDEEARIRQWGGFVSPAPEPGLTARVYLDAEFTMIGLAMSRSIGDYAVKAVGVIPDPEVKEFELEATDKFMILASDGVWEFISSQEACDIVEKSLEKGAGVACQKLIETAAARWQEEEGDYRDDITAIVVRFPLPYMTSTA